MIKSGNYLSITNEAELADAFRQRLFEDKRLHGISITKDPDAVRLKLDGKEKRFDLIFRLTASEVDLEQAKKVPHTLVVLPSVKEVILQDWAEQGLSVADLSGRLFLRAPGVIVSLPSIEGRQARFRRIPGTIYTGKSERIVRALLNHPHHQWRVSDLAVRTGASVGLVSRILSYLAGSRIVVKEQGARFRTVRPELLLKAWGDERRFSRRTEVFRYAGGVGSPVESAKAIASALGSLSKEPFAFTQAIAGWLRVPYTEPLVVSLYVGSLPSRQVLEACALRPVPEAGRVQFLLPDDPGVFKEVNTFDGLPLVCDPQIYVDLLHAGQRGEEQAEALLKSPEFWSR